MIEAGGGDDVAGEYGVVVEGVANGDELVIEVEGLGEIALAFEGGGNGELADGGGNGEGPEFLAPEEEEFVTILV